MNDPAVSRFEQTISTVMPREGRRYVAARDNPWCIQNAFNEFNSRVRECTSWDVGCNTRRDIRESHFSEGRDRSLPVIGISRRSAKRKKPQETRKQKGGAFFLSFAILCVPSPPPAGDAGPRVFINCRRGWNAAKRNSLTLATTTPHVRTCHQSQLASYVSCRRAQIFPEST